MAEWTQLVVPLSGGPDEEATLSAAAKAAAPFGAEIIAAFLATDVGPWPAGEFGGFTLETFQALQQAASESRECSEKAFERLEHRPKAFMSGGVHPVVDPLVRLADAVIFSRAAARGEGPLGSVFRQLLVGEGLPALVGPEVFDMSRPAVVAWDGGREAARAVRAALPVLARAPQVLAVTAHKASGREVPTDALMTFLERHGVKAEAQSVPGSGEAGRLIVDMADGLGAGLLVAGAFGRRRLEEFIFGGTTKTLIRETKCALLLSR